MAEIKVDATSAIRNIKKLNDTLAETEEQVNDVNSASVDMGQAFATMTHNTDDMTKGMDAANAILSNMGVNMGGVGKAMAAVKGIVPALNTGLKGVEGGFKGVAKAIAATGLGAIAVAVGLLASNWEKVSHWVKEFRKNINDTMPGLSKAIDFVNNAIHGISDWVKQIGEKLGGSKIGKWLGLDKMAEKMRNITVAVKAANESTKEWATGTEASVETVSKAAEKAEDKLKRIVIEWDKVDAASEKRKKDAARRRGDDFVVADVNLDADMLDAELDALSDYAARQMEMDNAVAENWIKNEARKKQATQDTIAVLGGLNSVLGAMMQGLESDSKAYKALATMQIIANTLAGAMSTFTALDNVTMAQKIASYASVIATGAGSIAALNSGKLTSTSSVPQLSTGLPSSTTAANTANMTYAYQSTQVYITDKQLSDNAAKQAKIKQQTVF